MQQNWSALIILAAFIFLFGGLAILFLKKARKRRVEAFGEDPELVERERAPRVEGSRELEEAAPTLELVPDIEPVEAEGADPEPVEREPVEREPVEREQAERVERAPVIEEVVAPVAEEVAAPVIEEVAAPVIEEVATPVIEEVVAPVVKEDSADAQALRASLKKTNQSFMGRISALFSGKSTVDDSVLDELEDVLLTADVGVRLVMEVVDDLRDQVSKNSLTSADDVRVALKARLGTALNQADTSVDPLLLNGSSPKVVLFVGVNGVGKTTSIGKIANRIKNQGHTVTLAAGDTFRAAAVEQLKIWGERTDCRVISGEDQADPASVIFNAVQHAVESKVDYLLADTAGRLHTKSELMDEISKVGRAAGKALDGAPHEIWLVVDGTTGQNALAQAREFNQALGLTGVILTKLDGTAKGGVVIAIANELKLPVRFVGVGEQADDLRPFKSDVFLDALFEPC